jgi:hypothetical protein
MSGQTRQLPPRPDPADYETVEEWADDFWKCDETATDEDRACERRERREAPAVVRNQSEVAALALQVMRGARSLESFIAQRRLVISRPARMACRQVRTRPRGADRPAASLARRGGDSGDNDGLADQDDDPPRARPGRAFRRARAPPLSPSGRSSAAVLLASPRPRPTKRSALHRLQRGSPNDHHRGYPEVPQAQPAAQRSRAREASAGPGPEDAAAVSRSAKWVTSCPGLNHDVGVSQRGLKVGSLLGAKKGRRAREQSRLLGRVVPPPSRLGTGRTRPGLLGLRPLRRLGPGRHARGNLSAGAQPPRLTSEHSALGAVCARVAGRLEQRLRHGPPPQPESVRAPRLPQQLLADGARPAPPPADR